MLYNGYYINTNILVIIKSKNMTTQALYYSITPLDAETIVELNDNSVETDTISVSKKESFLPNEESEKTTFFLGCLAY